MSPTFTLTLAQIHISLAFVLLVVGFGFVIFIHELGHFLVARWVGIKCPQFAVGFGQPIVAWRKGLGFRFFKSTEPDLERIKKEFKEGTGTLDPATLSPTEYRLNWIPLGGYVKMLGQEDLDATKTAAEDPDSFVRKSVGARFLVISAGVTNNAICAVIFFIIAFMYGVAFEPAIVGAVIPGTPAATTSAEGHPELVGLKPGDVIVEADGEKIIDFMGVRLASALAKRDAKVAYIVERPVGLTGEKQRLRFNIQPKINPGPDKLLSIGIHPQDSTVLLEPDSSGEGKLLQGELDKLGLRGGMTLTEINGRKVEDQYQVTQVLNENGGNEAAVTFRDAKGEAQIKLSPLTTLEAGPTADHLLGLVPPLKIRAVVPPREKLFGLYSIRVPADGKLLAGDIVLKVGDESNPTWPVFMSTLDKSRNRAVSFLVLRNGKEETIAVTPGSDGKVGVYPMYEADSNTVASVLPGSPFASLELLPQTRIEEVNGVTITDYTVLRKTIAAATDGVLKIRYTLPLPDENTRSRSGTVTLKPEEVKTLAALNWEFNLPPFDRLTVVQKADNVPEAVTIGFYKTHEYMMQVYVTLNRLLFERTVSPSNLSGPVGIASAGTMLTQRGLTYLMFFLGVISINLAVVNFLPFPVLDGGHAILLLLEKIRGKPVPVSVQNVLNMIGLVLILSLFLFVTWNDLVRVFSN